MGLLPVLGLAALAVPAFGQATYDTGTGVVYKIAIPDTQAAPFDIIVQVTAGAAVGWAGIAWGGTMLENPLTVCWPNGNSTMVSPRRASDHVMPLPFAGATVEIYPASKSSASEWTAAFLCKGCSNWGDTILSANSTNSLAWASSGRAVGIPSSQSSSLGIHDNKEVFSLDFSKARLSSSQWNSLVSSLQRGSNPTSTVRTTQRPVVTTSVVVLRPSSTRQTTTTRPVTTSRRTTSTARPTTTPRPVTTRRTTTPTQRPVTTRRTTTPTPRPVTTRRRTTARPTSTRRPWEDEEEEEEEEDPDYPWDDDEEDEDSWTIGRGSGGGISIGIGGGGIEIGGGGIQIGGGGIQIGGGGGGGGIQIGGGGGGGAIIIGGRGRP